MFNYCLTFLIWQKLLRLNKQRKKYWAIYKDYQEALQ